MFSFFFRSIQKALTRSPPLQTLIRQNMVIFTGRGCVTPIRTRGRRALPLGVELTQKVSKKVKK